MLDWQTLEPYIMSKYGTTKEFPFDLETAVYKVGGKMFALHTETDTALKINLKCDPLKAEEFRMLYAAVTPGYHMNKTHWNTVAIDGEIDDEEIYWMIDHSYDLIIKSLPKKKRPEMKE